MTCRASKQLSAARLSAARLKAAPLNAARRKAAPLNAARRCAAQRGAALIIAMLVFALATTMVVAMTSEFTLFLKRGSNSFIASQATAYLRGGEELAGLALLQDAEADEKANSKRERGEMNISSTTWQAMEGNCPVAISRLLGVRAHSPRRPNWATRFY